MMPWICSFVAPIQQHRGAYPGEVRDDVERHDVVERATQPVGGA